MTPAAEPAVLSDKLQALLDGPTFVTVVTLQPDGRPQASPVWVKRDGQDLLFSTTVGRRKTKNLERDGRVSLVAMDFDAPYVYAEIRGTARVLGPGPDADALIDELSRKYTGHAYADFNPASSGDAPRVIVRVTPEKVVGQGDLA